jgi:hypothetical protein
MRRLLAAVLAATALLLLTPLPATATSTARAQAAMRMARQVGPHRGMHGPALDRVLVLGAWHDAGVDTAGLDSPDALLHACTALQAGAPRPAGPAPADYALYRDAEGVQRIGMYLSQVDVAIVDGDAVRVVPDPELDGYTGAFAQERKPNHVRALLACRLAAARWPGGVDDVSIPAGRIALTDPTAASEHMRWTADHPRDADPGFWHPITRIFASLAETVTASVSSLIDSLVSVAGWLLHNTPWGPATPLLLLTGLLTRTFDGRRLHAILTAVVVAAVAVFLGLGLVLPLGWVIAGAVLGGASAAGVPVLGAIGGALVGAAFAVASFLVGALTGVDGSARVTVGSVVFALVADIFMLRPAMLVLASASRVGRIGAAAARVLAPVERLPVIRALVGHGRSTLDVAATAGDALALRPNAIVESAHNIRHGLAALRGVRMPPAPHILHEALPVHRAMSAAEAAMSGSRRSLDLLSLAWRPSSISSDLVGHAADALRLLDTELRTGLPSMPRLRALLVGMDPAVRKPLLDTAVHVSTHAVPQLRITARLSHLHSGARTVMDAATHNQPQRPWTRAARSPIVRRILRGLPEARR